MAAAAGPGEAIDISVVIPCFNEEENARPIADAVIAQLAPTGLAFEVIFIDNASTDGTVAIVKAMAAADPRIRLIANNRNYGQMRSPTYGIYQANGRAIIGLVADFQDPPELIPEFVRRWQAGASIVLGVREAEAASLPLRVARWASYGFLSRYADYQAVPNATGFGLYDRKVVDVLRRWNEPEPFYRGMLVESGFPIETVFHKRQQRLRGQSKNDFFRLLDFALSALSGSSKKLLRLPFTLAACMGLVVPVALSAAAIAAWRGAPAGPWLWLALFEFHAALLFGFLGLIGDQVRLLAERTRGAPLVVERERVNLPPPR